MKVSCLVLAAGDSSRMGGPNKLLLPVEGKPLVKRTLEEIEKFAPDDVVVVLGHEPERVASAIGEGRARTVVNESHTTGLHGSIKAGVRALAADCDAFFICLADQPYFSHETLATLLRALIEDRTKAIVAPTYEGQRGHPVLISRCFVDEILAEPDGDYGCAYLLKRHAELVATVSVATPGILIDVDEPADYAAIVAARPRDPIASFCERVLAMRASGEPFAVATVIEVIGSASARTGSKALFDASGKNLQGWVGGGCAERFVGDQAREAICEGRPRIVTADLDDEVFGLGVACGGQMRLFIEPVLPAELVRVADPGAMTQLQAELACYYGWTLLVDPRLASPKTPADLIVGLAIAAAGQRGHSARSLREVKPIPARFHRPSRLCLDHVTIVGKTRITEALARHVALVAQNVRVMAPRLELAAYPASVNCHCLEKSYDEISFRPGEVVIVATHTAQDPELVRRALAADAAYVATLGSIKRAEEALDYLGLKGADVHAPLFIPAGLDLDARSPDEIALSITAELVLLAMDQHTDTPRPDEGWASKSTY